MASQIHSHGDAPPHDHEGATPGHTHEAAVTAETTATPAHSHPETGSHTHADAAPGHTHEAAPAAAVDVRPTASGLATRILLTLLGAAGLIVGAFLPWFRFSGDEAPAGTDFAGINTDYSLFYSTDFPFGVDLIRSAGAVMILLGILAILGLAFRTGWLTTLAGVLGIVGFALILISLYRVPDIGAGVENVGLGLWIVLAGSVIAVIAGFFGTRPRAVAATRARY